MILARDPSDVRALIAQVTFIDGSQSDTARREGRLTRGGAFFGREPPVPSHAGAPGRAGAAWFR